MSQLSDLLLRTAHSAARLVRLANMYQRSPPETTSPVHALLRGESSRLMKKSFALYWRLLFARKANGNGRKGNGAAAKRRKS